MVTLSLFFTFFLLWFSVSFSLLHQVGDGENIVKELQSGVTEGFDNILRHFTELSAFKKRKSLKVAKWRKKEWWRMNEEWRTMISSCYGVLQTNICECRVAFATENAVLTLIDFRKPWLESIVNQVVTKSRGESALITCIVSRRGSILSCGEESAMVWWTINGEAVTI